MKCKGYLREWMVECERLNHGEHWNRELLTKTNKQTKQRIIQWTGEQSEERKRLTGEPFLGIRSGPYLWTISHP